MTKTPRIPAEPDTRRQGSALLLTLLVVSLMLVLVLGFTVFIRIELRQSLNRQQLIEARANARMAAMVALGELQRTLGPDTRVSARAELVSANTPDATGEANETTRFWTGVWDSAQESVGADAFKPYKGDRDDRFLSWLISLPSATPNGIDTVQAAVPASDDESVKLAHIRAEPLGGGALQPIEVRAPLLPAGDGGSYAWWVSDEGVKANVSLTDPFLGQSQSGRDDIPRYLFPHRENFAATTWFADTEFDDANVAERLGKLGEGLNTPWLAFRGTDISPEAETAMTSTAGSRFGDSLFSDYTIHSKGVISNNKKGGLRKDLSLAFWRDPDETLSTPGSAGYTPNVGYETDFSDRVDLHGRIFNKEDYPDRTVRSTLARSFFGPQWDTLRDYHNSFQKLQDLQVAGPTASLDGVRTSDPGNTNYRWLFGGPEKDSLHLVGDQIEPGEVLRGRSRTAGFVNSPLHPVVSGVNFYFQADLVEAAGSTTANPLYEPRFKIFTVVTLWNPYNVHISPRTLDGSDPSGWQLTNFIGDFEFIYEKNSSQVARFGLGELLASDTENRNIPLTIPNTGSNLDLRPGEIRQYRLTATGNLSPAFSEASIIFEANDIGFNASDNFSPSDTFQVTMEIPDNRLEEGGGTLGGLRMDLNSLGGGGLMQMIRFDFFDQENPNDAYTDLVNNVGSLSEDLTIGGVELYLRSAGETGSYSAGIVSNFTPRALFPGGALVPVYPGQQSPNYHARIVRDKPDPFPATLDSGRVLGFWGSSRELGESFVSLFDVPRRPPESLGQYQHASLSLFASQPANAFGNSMTHPHVNRIYAHDSPNGISQIDLSWFLNDAVWDEYFLSTLDPDAPDPSRPQRGRFFEIDPTRTFSVGNAEDYKNVAENLLVRGAFNVNSTSVEAWTAFLSALGSDNTPSGDLDFPYYRLTATGEPPNTAWSGGPRNLTAAGIRRLAEEMVEQVKERGPFLSLSDFVNRRLESGVHGRMGALQAAIEAANLNTVVSSDSASLPSAPYPGNVFGKAASLAPGELSQADVLTTIAPKMSVRSDTFVIRSYGTTDGQNTGVWAEMLVQRLPDEHPDSPFGRSFRILHFRYLNQDEI